MSHALSGEAIEHLVDWAVEAGKIGLKYFRQVTPRRKADNTFVTQADIEVEQFLTAHLRDAFPGHSIVGEEGANYQANTPDAPLWALDPIDGTTSFVHGLPGWGVNLGLLVEGKPVFGLFYMPMLNDLTYVTVTGECWWNGEVLQNPLRTSWQNKGYLAISSTSHQEFEIYAPRIRTTGSAGASLVYVTRGSAVLALIQKANLWDVVAGAAILEAVGGAVQYVSGEPLDYIALLDGNLAPDSIVAGHPDLLAQLPEVIARK